MMKSPTRRKRTRNDLRKRLCSGERLEARCLLAADTLLITEFMASNSSTLRDRFREYSDWIEVHNPNSEDMSADGWYLTDDPENLTQWQIPNVTIPASGYLVVFASNEDRNDPDSQLHANFKLASDGEYLAIVRPDSTVSHHYSPQYPVQDSDVSYGIVFDENGPQLDQHQYFAQPTPGEPNNIIGASGFVTDVQFSVQRGFFDQPFDVTLTTATPGAMIRYTTDSTAPTVDHGETYTGPITIDGLTTLRAAAFSENLLPSETGTQTYIFLDDVLTQDGEGLPEQWGYFDDQGPRRPARADANYGVDPDIVNDDRYRDTIKDDLRSVPTVSLVLDPDDVWEFENGLYSNPERTGDAWERPVSMEWINEEGGTEFQADAGLRIHGGWARRFSQTKKMSFRVIFRAGYGETTLSYPMFGEDGQQEFQAIVLRGGFNDSWRDAGNRENTFTQDQWTRQAQRDLGGHASRDRYVHLYLNGLYWGMYSPTERMNAEWAAAYMGGEPEEWDVINTGGNVIDGNTRAWSQFMRAVNRRGGVDYEEIKTMLDVEDYIDYMIVNQYVGNWDWPHNNWYASRRNVEGEKWRFHTWDAEGAFQRGIGEDRVNNNIQNSVGPSQVYIALREVPEFQRLYADRIHKHLFNDGQLSVQANIDRLNSLAAQMDRAIVGESARWGDGRNDQGRPITRDDWVRRIDAINRTYFPRRAERMIGLYRDGNLYPPLDPPEFNQFGGQVTKDFDILLATDIADGDIYYTLDDTDPRGPEGQPGESAIRLNTVDLVSGTSPAKTLVPSGAAGESDWQTLDFDDSQWTDAFAAIGYDTGEVDDPIEVPEGFRVVEIQSSGRVESFEDADLLLAGENVDSMETLTGVPFIDYLGGRRGGNFDNVDDFPIGGNDFTIDVTGTLNVRDPGVYTLGVTSNDAARLELDGRVLFADTARHGTEDKFVTVDLAEGLHDIRLGMFERSGTAVLEFYYAKGEKTEFDDDFLLVGDVQHRSFDDVIGTDLKDQLAGVSSSAYLRIPFEASQLDNIGGLFLRTQYDDGFVAHLNGTQIATSRAPETPSFDAAATGLRGDVDSLRPELIDVTAFKDLLRDGPNLLAIQALNIDKNDADLLLSPRLFASLEHAPINLDQSSTVRARVTVDGIWSALTEAEFSTAIPASSDNLRISEIHYHPRPASPEEIAAGFDDGNEFEFIEVVNIGQQAIDLAEVQFVATDVGGIQQGIEFSFADSQIRELAPGQFAVVVENLDAFQLRYGVEVPVAGQWTGRLSNATETIVLRAGADTVHRFAYSDTWHPQTDGNGPSLEVFSPASAPLEQWAAASTWRAGVVDGTPGGPAEDIIGDANRDGVFNSSDLVAIFQAGEYEDETVGNSTWEEGDFNGDGDFTTSDIVLAFKTGLYEGDPIPAAARADVIPPPTGEEDDSDELERLQHISNLGDQLSVRSQLELEARDSVFRGWR